MKEWFIMTSVFHRNPGIVTTSTFFDVIRALSLRHMYSYIDFESSNNNYLRLETEQKWHGIEKSHYFTDPFI